jgi:hypothetical protein
VHHRHLQLLLLLLLLAVADELALRLYDEHFGG